MPRREQQGWDARPEFAYPSYDGRSRVAPPTAQAADLVMRGRGLPHERGPFRSRNSCLLSSVASSPGSATPH